MTLAFSVRQAVIPIVRKAGSVTDHAILFPLRRVYCIGQNYADHAKEMGGAVNKASPFFFSKPADAVVSPAAVSTRDEYCLSIHYPSMTKEFHYEVELVVAIGVTQDAPVPDNGYMNIPPEKVANIIFGYSVGLDMTRRDLQLHAKQAGKPWDLAKGADESVVMAPIVPTDVLRQRCPSLFSVTPVTTSPRCLSVVRQGHIQLSVNGNIRQNSNIENMVSSVGEIVSILSRYVALRPGDVIFTGTPAGVGPVHVGEVMEASIEGIGKLSVTVEAPLV